MADEPDIIDILSEGLNPLPDSGRPMPAPVEPELGAASVEIVIDRDLAVQLVGSDAGTAKRMRPHGAMTAGGSPQELADVQTIMAPFLRDEIRRVHVDKTHRPRIFTARATPQQAKSLKAYCLRFAAELERHLSAHAGDDRHHRSQQRVDQARRVIAQVNAVLGVAEGDGRTLEQCRRAVLTKIEELERDLTVLRTYGPVDRGSVGAPLIELQEAVRRCLALEQAGR
jgi:hypothetical protein